MSTAPQGACLARRGAPGRQPARDQLRRLRAHPEPPAFPEAGFGHDVGQTPPGSTRKPAQDPGAHDEG
eukprot:3043535-Alexandrium_andersonii.AAC.1